MYICAVTCLIPKWNLYFGPVSSLCSFQWKLPMLMQNSYTASRDSRVFSRCRYYVTEGADRVTAHGSLGVARQFQPAMPLTNNCLYPGASRIQTAVKSNWCVTLTRMFKSFSRECSFLNESNARFQYCTRENYKFERAAGCVSYSSPDISDDCILRYDQNDTGILHLMKCALLCCLPSVPCTDNFLTYFSIVQRQLAVSHGREGSTRCLSQKPDRDSCEKPSASQLDNVQQLMIEQVIWFLSYKHGTCHRSSVTLVICVKIALSIV